MLQAPAYSILLWGIKAQATPLAVREQYNLKGEALQPFLNALQALPAVQHAVVLSTCNRFEIYLETLAPEQAQAQLLTLLRNYSSVDPLPYAFVLQGPDVFRHLMRVCAGLDSLVLGETYIVSQIKQALEIAAQAQTLGPALRRLFQKTLRTNKYIRTAWQKAGGFPSLESLVWKSIEQYIPACEPRILILGCGKMGHHLAEFLVTQKLAQPLLTNRTDQRAHELGQMLGLPVIAWQERFSAIRQVDVVVSAAASEHWLLQAFDLEIGAKPGLFIDLAVPRSLAPDLQAFGPVLNIDAFEQTGDLQAPLVRWAHQTITRACQDLETSFAPACPLVWQQALSA